MGNRVRFIGIIVFALFVTFNVASAQVDATEFTTTPVAVAYDGVSSADELPPEPVLSLASYFDPSQQCIVSGFVGQLTFTSPMPLRLIVRKDGTSAIADYTPEELDKVRSAREDRLKRVGIGYARNNRYFDTLPFCLDHIGVYDMKILVPIDNVYNYHAEGELEVKPLVYESSACQLSEVDNYDMRLSFRLFYFDQTPSASSVRPHVADFGDLSSTVSIENGYVTVVSRLNLIDYIFHVHSREVQFESDSPAMAPATLVPFAYANCDGTPPPKG